MSCYGVSVCELHEPKEGMMVDYQSGSYYQTENISLNTKLMKVTQARGFLKIRLGITRTQFVMRDDFQSGSLNETGKSRSRNNNL